MIKLFLVLLSIVLSPLVIVCGFLAIALIGSILFLIGLIIINVIIVIVDYIQERIKEC